MNQNQDFIYYAFISYSHKDEKWAKWLQRKLESYRLPTVIRKESAKVLPKRIAPVFLDATDLSVGKLNAKLNQELEASRYLIVVCSPNSAKPNSNGDHYVNKEVGVFSSLGRVDRIIPVIVDGVPGDPEKECFCPKIHELDLVGLDATKHSRTRILNDVVAKILSLRPDELWRREKRRIRRKRIIGSLAAAFLLAIALFAGWVAWDWNRNYTEYYADYVDQWGMPTGIFPLEKKQTLSRNSHYRFIYRKRDKLFGKRILREVIHCNSAGTPKNYEMGDSRFEGRPVRQKILYNDKYDLLAIDECENNGALREQRKFSGNDQSVIDFKIKDKNDIEYNTVRETDNKSKLLDFSPLFVSEGKPVIRRWVVQRDEFGYPQSITFYPDGNGDWDRPSQNADGCFGERYELDTAGRINIQSFLNEKGEDMTLKNGVAFVVYQYGKDSITSIAKKDSKGNTIEMRRFSYDDNGNMKTMEFYLGNQLSFCKDGFAKLVMEYDKHGNMTSISCFGVDGKPCLNALGFFRQVNKFDARGNLTEEAFFSTDGKPCWNKLGGAKIVNQYDKSGNLVVQAFYGTDDKPCLNTIGVAKVVSQYDNKSGKLEEQTFYGTDDKPCLNMGGYAKVVKQYDKPRKGIESLFFYGTDGKPCFIKRGLAKVTILYDSIGNVSETSFFDVDGTPCLDTYQGIAKIVYKYGKQGNRVEESYLDVNGKLCMNKLFGAAKITCQYDEKGNLVEESYFGIDGKPCLNKNSNVAKIEKKYDERGEITETSFFGTDGEPCRISVFEVPRITFEYNERGNLAGISFLSTDGELCWDSFVDATRVEFKCDERENVVEESYFGFGDGTIPTLHDGYAKTVRQYDERGKILKEFYLDFDDEPCLSQSTGVAKIEKKYDERGNLVEESYFDVDNKLCQDKTTGVARIVKKYDKQINHTEDSYFGDDGKLCLNQDGCAKIVYQHDPRGNITKISFFGVDGKLCLGSSGCAETTFVCDARNNITEMSFWGIDGNLCLHREGYARITKKYDVYENVSEMSFFGLDGKPCLVQGYAKAVWQYDSFGNIKKLSYFGVDDKPCMGPEGFSRVVSQFDDSGKCIGTVWFGPNKDLIKFDNLDFVLSCNVFDLW